MAEKLSPFKVIKFKNVRLMLLVIFLSQFGSQMQTVAINWHIYTLTHSAISLGLVGLVGFLPILFFSLPSGLLTDIFDRKILFFLSEMIVGIAASVLFIATFTHHVSPVFLYCIVAISALCMTIILPSRQSIIPSLVPQKHLMNTISINSVAWQSATILGPMVGGFLIALYGVQGVYIFNAFAAVISGLCMTQLIILNTATKEVDFNLHAIKEGIHFVLKTPLLYGTMLIDFFATFFASASTLMPIFAIDILHVGPQGVGLLYAAPAVGAVITGGIFSFRHTIKHQGRLLLLGVFFYGLAIVGFGFSRFFPLSLLCLVISGSGDMISGIIRSTLRQVITPDHLRGRMTSINMLFFIGGPYLGEIEAGFAAALLGTALSVSLGGAATVILTILVATLVPKILAYKGEELAV